MSSQVVADPVIPRWDRAAWYLIAGHVLLLLAQWPLLPWSLDVYYHLNVLNGFREAGGIVLHDFWEFAPAGRPHLYPPVLHLALLSLDWLHPTPITLARLAALLAYPALLLAGWWFAREWLGSIPAYWATVAAVAPFSYLLVACNTIAASWALVFWLLGLIAIRRCAWVAFVLCGTLVFYTHLGVPWLMLCSWGLLGCCYAPLRKPIGVGTALVLLLASPWLVHLGLHARSFGPASRWENASVQLPILVYGLAVWGGVLLLRLPRSAVRCVVASLLAGLLPLLTHYRFRFFSGQGLLGLSVCAGLALAAIHHRLEMMWPQRFRRSRWLVPIALTALLLLGNPTLFIQARGTFLAVGDSSFSNLVWQDNRIRRSHAESLYRPALIDPLVCLIRDQTRTDEIIGCNLPYACGMLAALSGRALATAMLTEVRGQETSAEEALGHAHLIVWFKIPPASGIPSLDRLRTDLELTKTGETEMAFVFRNPRAGAGRRASKPVMPLWPAQVALWSMVGLIVVDLNFASRNLLARTSAKIPRP